MNIELRQLLTMTSRARTQLTEIIKLQSNLNKKKTERFSTTKSKRSVQFVEQMKEINHVHELMFNNLRSNSLRRHTMKFKNLYKRMKSMTKTSRNDFKNFYRRLINFASSHVSFANSLVKNFYTQAIVKSRKSLFNT